MFVINNGNSGTIHSTVSVIQDSSNTVVANITVGTGAQSGIAYDSNKGEIFVVNGDGTVSVISDSSNTVIDTITVGTNPWGAAYDSAKNEIFVSNEGDSSVSVISDSTNTVVATITGSISGPEGLAYDSNKGEIFVADYPAASFSVISDKDNSVVKTVDMSLADNSAANPSFVAVDPATGKVFVATVGALQVISDSDNAVTGYYQLTSLGIAYDSGKAETFVASYDNALSVIPNSASSSTSSSPTSSTSPTTSSTPAVPEFSNTALISLAAAMVLVASCAVIVGRKNKKANESAL
jgi:YVTN family beta-propeller protein